MLVNSPPAYTVAPLTTRDQTVKFALGFQAVATPVEASSAAMQFLGWPPMKVKIPPT